MSGNSGKIVGLVFGLLLLVFFFSGGRKEEVKWEENYSGYYEGPLGTRILMSELDQFFTGEVYLMEDPPTYDLYEYHSHYIFINNHLDMDVNEIEYLNTYALDGNYVLLVARSFSDAVEEQLGVRTNANGRICDSIGMRFPNPWLPRRDSFQFRDIYSQSYFSAFDTLGTELLASNLCGQATLVKIQRGEGAFLVCTLPTAFTDFYLLHEEDRAFAFHTLSYMPVDFDVFWDEYYKVEAAESRLRNRSELGYILSFASFRWAFAILLTGALLFWIFEGKRKQRTIPVLDPLPNTTRDFVVTIGKLYYQKGSHISIAEKMIKVLLDQIRTRYRMPVNRLDISFRERLASKSGLDPGFLNELFYLITEIRKQTRISEQLLLQLSDHIEKFNREGAA